VIVGTGMHNGNTEAFVVVIAEPSSLALLGFGSICLLRRRPPRHGKTVTRVGNSMAGLRQTLLS
jgi:hypothetical protein